MSGDVESGWTHLLAKLISRDTVDCGGCDMEKDPSGKFGGHKISSLKNIPMEFRLGRGGVTAKEVHSGGVAHHRFAR